VGADAVISADHFTRLTAINLTPDQLQVVLTILAETKGADDARRKGPTTAAQRQARYRERIALRGVTPVTSRDVTLRHENPPDPLKK
jgi:hypothetical protein